MKSVGPSMRQNRAIAEPWLASLAPLVMPLFPADAAEAMRAYLPLLDNVPAEAFNRDTLEAAARCARGRHGVPTYAELRAVLASWCHDHRPVRQALPKPRDTVPESERCTPEQAAEILRRHGWTPAALRPWVEPRPVRASQLTPAQLAQMRRQACMRQAGMPLAETRA